MPRRRLPRPTSAELEILRVLWQRGPSTVRQVYEELNRAKPTGYTTVLKFMQIMVEKGLARRNEEQRTHVYEPVLPREATQQQLVGDLLDRVFSGSASQLVMRALAVRRAGPREIEQIRQMLDEYERGSK